MKIMFVAIMIFFSHLAWLGENMLDDLSDGLRSRTIVGAKLYLLPYGITTIVAVDRNMIVDMTEPYLIIVNDKEREKLIDIIKSSRLRSTDGQSDLRSAVEFLDVGGEVVFSIYFSGQSFFGDGRYGYVSEHPVKGLGKFQKWIKKKRTKYKPRIKGAEK